MRHLEIKQPKQEPPPAGRTKPVKPGKNNSLLFMDDSPQSV
jgi:hypothetical protein